MSRKKGQKMIYGSASARERIRKYFEATGKAGDTNADYMQRFGVTRMTVKRWKDGTKLPGLEPYIYMCRMVNADMSADVNIMFYEKRISREDVDRRLRRIFGSGVNIYAALAKAIYRSDMKSVRSAMHCCLRGSLQIYAQGMLYIAGREKHLGYSDRLIIEE